MHLDNQAIFSDAQDCSGSTDIDSTNVIDTGELGQVAYNPNKSAAPQLKRRLGVGMIIPLLIQVVEDFAGLTTDFTLTLEQSSDEAFTAPESVMAITVPKEDLVKGYIFSMDKIPREVTQRYIRLNYAPDANPSAGKITAGITTAVDGGYRG